MKRISFLFLFISIATAMLAQNITPVDLGLSVKWGDRNIGASTPYDFGEYFAWAEVTTKKEYWWANYAYKDKTKAKYEEQDKRHGKQGRLIKSAYNLPFDRIPLDKDIAHIRLGGKWRMPTAKEIEELKSRLKKMPEKHKGTKLAVFSYQGQSIVLPAGGEIFTSEYDNKTKILAKNKSCRYWSSDFNPNTDRASALEVDIYDKDAFMDCYAMFPTSGLLIRPVYDEHLDNPQPQPKPQPQPAPQPQPKPVVVTKNVPTFAWATVPATTTLSSVKISVGIQSKSRITATHVYVNGQLYRGIKAVTNDGADMRIEQTLPLVEGSNIIKVSATNSDGTATSERTIVRQGAKPAVVTQGKRIALVIGNANYPEQRLVNPQNDATDMAAKLRSLGFEVILLQNGSKKQIEDAISTLGQRASGYDAAMFYYAGHGIQYKGANYLIPVNANLRSASDIEYECTDMGRVLSKLDESGCKMKIIALDACRNNPFERSWYRGTASQGLTAVNAPVGTFISYATSPGSVAADGQTRNSPYTTALLKTLDTPGLTIESVFKRVAASVFSATNHQQMPWYASSLFQGDFIFNNQK